MKGLSDSEVLAICNGELTQASESSELATKRAEAIKRYHGELLGDEVEGRSQFTTREVYEVVEGMMPGLMRIFTEAGNLVVFDPVGPEDEDQAEQETDLVNHVFWHQNAGFLNLYTMIKDALLTGTGVLKAWADTSDKVEREEYKGLSDIQLGQLLQEPYVDRQIIEYELTEEGHHLVCTAKWEGCDIKIVPVAPEEFGVSRHARSPLISDAQFVYCRFKKTLGDLILEGYDKDFLMTLPTDDGLADEEEIARRNLEDEQEWSASLEWSLRTVWVSECYAKIDRDGDGIPELLQVTLAGGSDYGAGTLMDIQEIDSVPLFATPAVINTHKFYGGSLAESIIDIQEQQTTLLRQVLDNTYLANNGQTAVNTDYVSLDDLLTKRPGGVVRFSGDAPWNSVVGPIPASQLPPQTSELFERLDERMKRRTGYGDEVAALDVKSLSNVNSSVAALAFDMARAKAELLARVIAEVGLKPLFHHVHELMVKNKYRTKAVRIRNRWIETDPTTWRNRKDSTVQVGIGIVSRERKIMGAEAILDKHRAIVGEGGMGSLLMPHHLYEAHKMWIEAWGFEPEIFLQDPRQLPPPPPRQPQPQDQLAQAQAQALMMDGQAKMQRVQIDQQKAQTDQQKLMLEAEKIKVEAQYKTAEQFMRQEIERLKAEAQNMRAEMESGAKVVSMQHESQMRELDRQIDMMGQQLNHIKAERDRDLDYYKTLTTAAVKGEMPATPEEIAEREAIEAAEAAASAQKAMESEMREGQRDAMITRMFEEMRTYLSRAEETMRAPRSVEYDDKGLMKAIGGKSVTRDPSGRIVQIG